MQMIGRRDSRAEPNAQRRTIAPPMRRLIVLVIALLQLACGGRGASDALTFAGSAVGREGEILRRQLASFEARHPGVHVELRAVPDAAEQQHQLYVQWLNAHSPEPDVLQLDVIMTPEFAAAGWILPLDRFQPPTSEFFPATIEANRVAADRSLRCHGSSMLACCTGGRICSIARRRHSRSSRPPSSRAQRERGMPFGFVWSGARYEGLVTVFLEYLHGFGGAIPRRDRACDRRL